MVNFGSVKNKVAEFAACLETHEPDIVLGSETWLNQSVGDKEIFPDNYTVIRKDREDSYGGVLIFFFFSIWSKLYVNLPGTIRFWSYFLPTTQPLLIKQKNIPGMSDHDGIPIITVNLCPKRCKQKPRKVYLFHKADLEGMKEELKGLCQKFVVESSPEESIEVLWCKFKENLRLLWINTFRPM